MRVASLFSGGKDSNYALYWAIKQGWDVSHLITVYPENIESYMYQTSGLELTELAAKATGIPHVKVWTPGKEGSEVQDLEVVLARIVEDEAVEGLVSGAMRSNYQKDRIDRMCAKLNIKGISPTWHKDPEEHLRTLLKEAFDIVFVGVSAEGLGPTWLGRHLDEKAIQDLLAVRQRYAINIDGEGGEFETIVLDAPHYKMRVVMDEFERSWQRDCGRLLVHKAHLENK
jgi:ABC transporter with metal-binding/Fe-S-binding domain ATP-binding protein